MTDESFVLTASSKTHHWKGEGLCSIKTFSNGDAYYNTGKGFFRVDENSFLLLNNKTEYEILIDNEKETNSFCVFFSSNLLKDLFILQSKSINFILENYGYETEEINYFERTYESNLLENSGFQNFKDNYSAFREDKLWLSQSYVQLLHILPGISNIYSLQLNNLNFKKTATKVEIFRRLLMAKEFLHCNVYGTTSLEELSRISLLSVNLLIRLFKQAFGITPHQYFINVKMKKAKELLRNKNKSVTDICNLLQLSSIGSFSNSFKRKTGITPSEFQKK
jgi:AraC-like DNA-binding protein